MLEEERTKRMNELEKMAKRHKRKQKYPMSIFPDYKKGAEEFNKNSTPLNQDALSSADASSGMAEDIERNKKKGINEEMDDFLYWEIAEPQCTGYDCDDNIEYVYGDNENRVWIEQDGKKYKVYVNQWDTKPTATFTSLKKAKAFGEKYWQDNYGYIDESLSEEYIPDITQRYPEGFNGESAYRTPWDDEYRAWDELSRQQKEEEEEFERLKKTAKYKLIREYDDYDSEEDFFQTKQDALNYVERLCDDVYRYNKNGHKHPLTYLTLENIKTGKSKRVSIEDMLDYYNGTNQTNESLNESNDEDMGYKLGKWLGARLLTGWTAMLNVDGAEESPYYDEYDQWFDGTFVQCLKKLKEYQDIIDRDGVPAYLALQSSHDEYFDGDYDTIIDKLYDRGYLYDDDIDESLNESKNTSLEEIKEYFDSLSDSRNLPDYSEWTLKELVNYYTTLMKMLRECKRRIKEVTYKDEDDFMPLVYAIALALAGHYYNYDTYDFRDQFDSFGDGIMNIYDNFDADTIQACIDDLNDEIEDIKRDPAYGGKPFPASPLRTSRSDYADWKKFTKFDESLNEDCNSYSYKGKTIINAGDYWFVKGFKEKFPTSDEAEEFIDDKKKDESFKVNIRESLNKMDAESDNTYDLLNLYESKNLSKSQKKDIARMIYENYGLEKIYNYLYEATEDEDELPVEDRIKELTNNFKNTNGSYVFEEVQDANKAVAILKSRGYESSQKRTQDGKYRVTADKKNK